MELSTKDYRTNKELIERPCIWVRPHSGLPAPMSMYEVWVCVVQAGGTTEVETTTGIMTTATAEVGAD